MSLGAQNVRVKVSSNEFKEMTGKADMLTLWMSSKVRLSLLKYSCVVTTLPQRWPFGFSLRAFAFSSTACKP